MSLRGVSSGIVFYAVEPVSIARGLAKHVRSSRVVMEIESTSDTNALSRQFLAKALDARRAENSCPSLASLSDDFFNDGNRCLGEISRSLQSEIDRDALSKKVYELGMMHRSIHHHLDDILQQRLQKIVMYAVISYHQETAPPHLIPKEKALFERISSVLKDYSQSLNP